MTRQRMAVVIALLLTGLGGDVRAEGPPDSGATLAKRVVSMFDFEERQRGNFEDMPRHWYRIHQEGFPRYTLENTALRQHRGPQRHPQPEARA
jgi:hypothetical protein